jgi:hypothetical protein
VEKARAYDYGARWVNVEGMSDERRWYADEDAHAKKGLFGLRCGSGSV